MSLAFTVRAVLLDIEGTTGSIAFVHEVLFPYARTRLADHVAAHPLETAPVIEAVRALERDPGLSVAAAARRLEAWSDEDRKAAPLKTLQGMIWREGYESGALKGHVHADAEQALRAWKAAGLGLYIYSSGSVEAQQLLFAHSVRGDLTPLLSGYFDTAVGPKQDPDSYRSIAAQIGLAPADILFLSDSAAEIEAATAAGLQAVLVDRTGATGLADFGALEIRPA